MKDKLLKSKTTIKVFWIVFFISLWEVVSLTGIFNQGAFPSVKVIIYSLYDSIIRGEIIGQTLFSLGLILRGLIIGIALALILSSVSMISKVFEGLVETLLSIAHPLPGIALLPLIILWIGVGTNSIIFIIVHSVVWPMTLNLMTGFRSIPQIYNQVGRNYGLRYLGLIGHILIPASLPYFLSGMRIAWARAWRALISAEMIFGAAGGIGGLGWFIFKKRAFMDTPGIFSGLIVIVLIGIAIEDILFNKLENITIRKWGMTI